MGQNKKKFPVHSLEEQAAAVMTYANVSDESLALVRNNVSDIIQLSYCIDLCNALLAEIC